MLTQDLSYLLPEPYSRAWSAKLAAAPLLRDVHAVRTAKGAARLQYNSQLEYDAIGYHLMMLREWKVNTSSDRCLEAEAVACAIHFVEQQVNSGHFVCLYILACCAGHL